jgi:valyl-tRNA synthetase
MAVQNLFLEKIIPFKNVIIHGLVRDVTGKKMSKTLNNGVDPIVLIEKYGLDVVRWFVLSDVALGSDFIFLEKNILFGRKLVNKI